MGLKWGWICRVRRDADPALGVPLLELSVGSLMRLDADPALGVPYEKLNYK